MKTTLLLLALAAVTTGARADNDDRPRTCGLSTIKGNYALTLTGKATGSGEVAGVGQVTIDGNGRYSGTTTGVFSMNGLSTSATTPVNGTYTLKSDCTGTVVVNFVNLHLTVEAATVFSDGGNQGRFVVTAPSQVFLSGTARKQ